MKISFLLTFCVAIAIGLNAQTTLTLNLEQGKEYRQNSEAKMTMSQDIAGQTLDIVATIKGKVVYQVKSVTPTGYEMDIRYEMMAMEMQMPQATMKFSSENPAQDDIISQVLFGVLNKPFQAHLSKTGKITDVRNVEALFTSAFEKFPNLSDAQKEQIKSQLNQSYGADAFASNMEMTLAIFPNKPVKVGEKWTIETKMKSMSAVIASTYQYVEDGSDVRAIRGEAKITADPNGNYIVSSGMEMKFTMNGTMVSDIKVDKKTGWVRECKVTQTISGDAHVKGNEQMPEGMTIPMSIKSEVISTN